MDKEKLEMVGLYLVPPAAFALAAIYWLSRITPQQLATGAYSLALGAVILGMGLTLIGAFVVLGKLKKGGEGQAYKSPRGAGCSEEGLLRLKRSFRG